MPKSLWDSDFTSNILYQKLLTDKLSADLGYVYEYSSRIQQAYLIHGKDLRKDGSLKCLPFYMTPFL